jgi:hypothetical protein
MILKRKQGGFAFLVFVIIMAMSLLVMIVDYSENKKRIGDNVREIVKTERGLQSTFICISHISGILSKHSQLNTDLILGIKSFQASESADKNYWINGVYFNNYKIKGDFKFNCMVLNFDKCGETDGYTNIGVTESEEGCDYKAIVVGNNSDGGVYTKIYIEWKLDEYRFYIKKLNLIN